LTNKAACSIVSIMLNDLLKHPIYSGEYGFVADFACDLQGNINQMLSFLIVY